MKRSDALYILSVAFWMTLALTTLYLVVKTDNALVAALVAWTGGLMTLALYYQTRKRFFA